MGSDRSPTVRWGVIQSLPAIHFRRCTSDDAPQMRYSRAKAATGHCDDMTGRPPGFFDGTEMPNAGWWEALWPDPAGVLAAVGVKPDMTVMDLCSGDGWFTLQIAKLARHVVAIDIDADLLDVARHRLGESKVTNCDFMAGNAYELTRLWPRPVDFVFLANAFHGVPDRPRLARS